MEALNGEFEKLLKKYIGMDIHEQWKFRYDELMEKGMTYDEASKTVWRDWQAKEFANPVDLMSMAPGGDFGTELAEIEKYDEMCKVLQNEYNNWKPSEIAMR